MEDILKGLNDKQYEAVVNTEGADKCHVQLKKVRL